MQHMLHTARLISKSINLFLFVVFIGGCATSLDETPEAYEKSASKQRVLFASFDQVWRAAHAVIKYPIANENIDTGIIETDYIKAVDGWLPPNVKKPSSAGVRYKLVFIIVKGKSQGQASTRVTIDKKVETQRDFFAETQELDSDGLEEKILFYRMERELVIQQGLKKAGN